MNIDNTIDSDLNVTYTTIPSFNPESITVSVTPSPNESDNRRLRNQRVIDAQPKLIEMQWNVATLRNPLSAPGDRIKAVLQLKNLSSRELARRTRLSRVRIKKIMSNEIYPNLEDVRLINAALYKDYGLNLLL